jgi:DNA-binding XRE family transcriptional regulator
MQHRSHDDLVSALHVEHRLWKAAQERAP